MLQVFCIQRLITVWLMIIEQITELMKEGLLLSYREQSEHGWDITLMIKSKDNILIEANYIEENK